MSFEFDGVENQCIIGEGVSLTGWIRGRGNVVKIDKSINESKIDLRINGNYNLVTIYQPFAIKSLSISIGNHIPAHSAEMVVGEGFSIEGGGSFLLYNSGNKLNIGKNCMFSNMVTIRCGESPHLLFDRVTGDYLDISDGVSVGDHVWVGEKCYLTKRVQIPSECVIAACSVVTKKFDQSHSVIAGNPARVVRENIEWVRNHSHLVDGSPYDISYKKCADKYKIFR